MGGSGSTRWRDHHPKRLVEAALRLDLLDPQLLPLLQGPAPATWTTTISTGRASRQWLAILSASEPDGSRDLTLRRLPLDIHDPGQLIRVVRVKAGFDQRLLGKCPSCDRRAQILYALPEDGALQCRSCLALVYKSSREWDGRVTGLAKAMLRGDEATMRYWQARGSRPPSPAQPLPAFLA